MTTPFRYVAIPPDRIGEHRKLKTASYLLDFLTDHQTDASGWVNYGRPFGYAWIRANWHGNPDERPPLRTLERWMATLKEAGRVIVQRLPFGGGLRVRVMASVKWSKELPEPAEQIPMFGTPVVQIRTVRKQLKRLSKTCGKPEISTVSQIHIPPNMAVVNRQKWRLKEVKKYNEEKGSGASRSDAWGYPQKTPEELDARRRELLDQATKISQKFKSAG